MLIKNTQPLPHLQIVCGTWPEQQTAATYIRQQVFVEEQCIAAKDEWDEHDVQATHFVVYERENVIATARLLQNHHVGRVAVLKAYRGMGIGHALMQAVISHAQAEQRPFLKLSSQLHAQRFYHALGFIQQGEVYIECGIAHLAMCLADLKQPE